MSQIINLLKEESFQWYSAIVLFLLILFAGIIYDQNTTNKFVAECAAHCPSGYLYKDWACICAN